jgi:hypothetical protein
VLEYLTKNILPLEINLFSLFSENIFTYFYGGWGGGGISRPEVFRGQVRL